MSPILGIAIIPLVLAVGVAVDHIRHFNARTELMAALDGAALAAAQLIDASKQDRVALAQAYFSKNFHNTEIANPTADVDVNNKSVHVSANFQLPTSFMRLAGINTLALSAESEANLRSAGNAELVLVLDYSGSMNYSQKYQRMSAAAIDMLNALEKVTSEVDLRVGLVPFSAMVRTSMSASYVTQSSAGATWTGCTQDRAFPHNRTVSTPTADPATKWGYFDTQENSGSYGCSTYNTKKLNIKPLTTDIDSIRTQLADMRPLGNTNIALGAEFGWNLLDPALPFDEAKPYDEENNRKFLVLLTDGVQTSREFGSNSTRSVSNAQTNLTALCNGMRATDITIFAIAYDVTNPQVTTLLEGCAPGRYFEPAVGGNDLNAVFAEITNQITDDMVRLTK